MENQLNIIRLEDLGKSYNSPKGLYPVLNDISCTFGKGSFNVILGESGSGKTTLLKLIGGLLHPSKGRVFFKERSMNQLNFSQLAEIRRESFGFTFQEAGLLDHLTNGENILFPRLNVMDQDMEAIAAYLGITHCLEKFPAEISLGEKQRVVLARALIGKPEIIIADEPTANLDWANAKKSIQYLRDYSAGGATVFVATHDERITDFATSVLKIQKENK